MLPKTEQQAAFRMAHISNPMAIAVMLRYNISTRVDV